MKPGSLACFGRQAGASPQAVQVGLLVRRLAAALRLPERLGQAFLCLVGCRMGVAEPALVA